MNRGAVILGWILFGAVIYVGARGTLGTYLSILGI